MKNNIHPTAIISEQAKLGNGNRIGPFVVIEDDVELGNDNIISSGVILRNGTRMGNSNQLHEYAVMAGEPQDLGFDQSIPSYAELGDDNVIRESVIIHRASKAEQATRLGNSNYLMTLVHVGHDCQLGDNVIIAPSTGLGGHVQVDDRAFISGGVMIHQFVRVGRLAMIGGNSKITQDVLPYMITDGVPGHVRGLNVVGLKRAGFKAENLRVMKKAYQVLFRAGDSLEGAVSQLRAMREETATHLADFISDSRRGFHRDKP